MKKKMSMAMATLLTVNNITAVSADTIQLTKDFLNNSDDTLSDEAVSLQENNQNTSEVPTEEISLSDSNLDGSDVSNELSTPSLDETREGNIDTDKAILDTVTSEGALISKEEVLSEGALISKEEVLSGDAVYLGETTTTTVEGIGGNIYLSGNIVVSSDPSIVEVTIPENVTEIGEGAFDSTNLERVHFAGEKVQIIREGAFISSRLKSITLPNGLKTIEREAFAYCTELEELDIPASVTRIDRYAFSNCEYLSKIHFRAKECNISEDAFEDIGITSVNGGVKLYCYEGSTIDNMEGLNIVEKEYYTDSGDTGKYPETNGVISYPVDLGNVLIEKSSGYIIGYNGTIRNVILPQTVNGVTIKGVAERAFAKCISLENIELPNTVDIIGEGAFERSSLASIKLPTNLKEIRANTFKYTGLKSIELPNTIEIIGNNAFEGSDIASLNLPDSLKVIGDCAFLNTGHSRGGVEIPAGVESIGKKAFYNSYFDGVLRVSGSVKSIGEEAFAHTQFTEAYFETGVTSLPSKVFYGSSIINVELGDTISSVGDNAFTESKLKNIRFYNPGEVALGKDCLKTNELTSIYCYRTSNVYHTDNGDLGWEIDEFRRSVIALDSIPDGIEGLIFDKSVFEQSIADYPSTTGIPVGIENDSQLYWIWRDKYPYVRGSKVFDLGYYKANNREDSKLNQLTNSWDIFNHFLETNGTNKGALSTSYWGKVYQSRYADLAGLDGDALLKHYLTIGILEGRNAGIDEGLLDENGYYLYEVNSYNDDKAYLHIDLSIGSVKKADYNVRNVYSIPDSILGKEIKNLDKEAFKDCIYLESVVLNSKITTINGSAFEGCENLRNLNISNIRTIGKYAFKGCVSLSNLELPNVMYIEFGGFDGCTNLVSVEMPLIRSIGGYAFNNTGISFWELPNSVNSIGEKAFSHYKTGNCTVLIPQSVTSISTNVLSSGIVIVYKGSGADITYNSNIKKYYADTFIPYQVGGGYIYIADSKVVFADPTVTDVNIPAKVGTIVVNGIDADVFRGLTEIRNVSIEDGVKYIGWSAFAGSSVSRVSLPESLSEVGSHTFRDCTNLASINLENITKIGDSSFENCKGLTELTLNKVSSLGRVAFKGCSGLKRVTITSKPINVFEDTFLTGSPLNIYCYAGTIVDNISLYSEGSVIHHLRDGNIYAAEGGNIYYDESGYIIGADKDITSAVIPEEINGISIVGVRANALSDCAKLRTISFSSGLGVVEDYAFSDCVNLESVVLPKDTVKSIGVGAFKGCTSLLSFSLPTKVSLIEKDLFRGCTNLLNVEMHNGIISVGDRAFYGCEELTELYLPKSVTQIGLDVFTPRMAENKLIIKCYINSVADRYVYPTNIIKEYVKLREISVDGGNIYIDEDTGLILDADKSIKEVMLPYNIDVIHITGVDYGAFKGCNNLSLVLLPMTATSMSDYAFADCSNLRYISLPGVQSIGDAVFSGCTNLTKINIPTSAGGTSSTGSSFISNDFLKGSSVSEISCVKGSYFHNNSSILANNIKINAYTEIIETETRGIASYIFDVKYYVDNNKSLLQNIGGNPKILYTYMLNNDIDKSPMYMFDIDTYYKYNPEVAAKYGTNYRNAFDYFITTDFLNKVASSKEYSGDAYQSRYSDLKGLSAEELIIHYVTKGRSEGRNASPFELDVNGYLAYPVVGGNIYIDLKTNSVVKADVGITDVVIPEYVYGHKITTIKANVFSGKSKLKSVKLNGITTIEDNAFEYCTSLNLLEADNLSIVGDNVFTNTSLVELYLPSLTVVGENSFINNNSLEVVSLPNLKVIDVGTFKNNSSLNRVDIPKVTTIKKAAFDNCSALNEVNMPSVEVLEDAFNGIKNKIWYLPNTIKNIGSSVFDAGSIVRMPNTTNTIITSDFMDSGTVLVYSDSSANKVVYKQGITKIVADGDVVIYAVEGGYLYIVDGVVVHCDDTVVSASIPQEISGMKVHTIADGVFKDNTNLKSLILPITVMQIGKNAFMNCSSLGNIDLGGVREIGKNSELVGCTSLSNITMDNVITIHTNAFKDTICGNWNLSNKVEVIGKTAFPDNSRVYLPNSAREIDPSLMNKGIVIVNRGSYADKGVVYSSNITKIYADGLISYKVTGGNIYIDVTTGFVVTADSTITDVKLPESVSGIKVVGIGDNAFNGCTNLKNLEFTNNITDIGDFGLANTGLTSLKLPTSLVYIGDNAFSDTLISEIEIPENVVTIGNNAFSNSQLKILTMRSKSATLGQNLFGVKSAPKEELSVFLYKGSTLDSYSFSDVSKVTKTYLNASDYDSSGYYLYKVEGGYLHIDLPNGKVMFADKSVISIRLPEIVEGRKITSIADNAISGCTQLKTVELPYITVLGTGVFSGCTQLERVSAFDSLTVLPSNTFNGCTKLSTVGIPYLEVVGEKAFYNCTSLTDLMDTSLTYIDSYAFYNTAFNNRVIPESVTFIGSNVFGGNTNLKEITVKTRNANISTNAFSQISSLSTVYCYKSSTADKKSLYPANTQIKYLDATIEDMYYVLKVDGGNLYIDLENGTVVKADKSVTGFVLPPKINGYAIKRIDNGVFKGNTNLVIADLGSVTDIGYEAFRDCINLKTISGYEVKSLEGKVFKSATSLAFVSMPYITSMSMDEFEGCVSLKSITLNNIVSLPSRVFADSGLQEIKAPNLESIGDKAFNKCSDLKLVSFPNVKEVGTSAFYNCLALEQVSLPNVNVIGDRAFSHCSNLSQLDITNVKQIGDYAFSHTYRLNNLVLRYLNIIGTSAFESSLINSIEIPNITKINDSAFAKCNALKNVVLGANLREIPMFAFDQCYNLQSINLENIQSIGNSAFSGCNQLGKIKFSKSVTLGDYAFNNCEKMNIDGFSFVTAVGEYTFNHCESLEDLENSNISAVGKGAFRYCTNLKNVKFDNADSVGDEAFKFCSVLETMILPKARSIGTEAFNKCYKLSSIDIPNIVSIDTAAFRDTTNLGEIELPASLLSFGSGDIFERSGLKKVVIYSQSVAVNPLTFDKCGALDVYCYRYTPADKVANYPDGSTMHYIEEVDLTNYKYKVGGGYIYVNLLTGTVVGSDANITSVVLPEYIEGYKIKAIDGYAFQERYSLSSIDLSYIETIGKYAFDYCTGLESVKFGASLKQIQSYAFSECWLLTDIDLSKSKGYSIGYGSFANVGYETEAGYNAFNLDLSGCASVGAYAFEASGLSECTLGKETVVTKGAFDGGVNTIYLYRNSPADDKNLYEEGINLVYIEEVDLTNYKYKVGGGYIYVNLLTGTVTGSDYNITSVTIPSEIEGYRIHTIDNIVFYERPNLVYLDLSHIETIKERVFSYCTNLQVVKFGASLKQIQSYAFEECPLLTNIDLSKSKGYSIGHMSFANVGYETEAGYNAFNLDLSGCASVGAYAFEASGLSECTLGKETVVTKGAFDGGVNTIYLYRNSPADDKNLYEEGIKLVYLDADANGNYKYQVEGGYIYVDLATGTVVGADDTVTKVTIPSEIEDTVITSIGKGAFKGKKLLTEIDLGECTVIGYEAFRDCSLLHTVKGNKVISIMGKAFKNTPKLNNLIVPVIENISEWVFEGSGSLGNKDTFKTLKSVGDHAFYKSGVEELNLPNLIEAGVSAFSYTDKLKAFSADKLKAVSYRMLEHSGVESVSLSTATIIGEDSFHRCSFLVSITLPSVTKIEGSAFSQCTSLESVMAQELRELSEPEGDWGDAFLNCGKLRTFIAPKLEVIGSSSFSQCTSLVDIEFGDNVTSVGFKAFNNCVSLKSIKMPKLEILKDKEFNYCTSLTSVSFDSLETTGYDSFGNCYSLSDVSMPNVVTVGANSFYDCWGLTSIDLPKATTIGAAAFENSALSTINMPNVKVVNTKAFAHTNLKSVDMTNLTKVGYRAFCDTKLTNLDIRNKNIQFAEDVFVDTPTLKYVHCYKNSSADNRSLYDKGVSIYYYEDLDSYYKYAVEGGYVYIDLENGTVVSCDESITKVVLPEFIEGYRIHTIGEEAFYFKAEQLRELDLSYINVVKKYAFYNADSLESIKFNCLEDLQSYSLGECHNLTYIDWGSSTNFKIGSGALNNTYNLDTLDLTNCVSLGDAVFESSNIKNIILGKNTKSTELSFSYIDGDVNVYLYRNSPSDIKYTEAVDNVKFIYIDGSIISHKVEGGYIYIDISTGKVVKADSTVTKVVIPDSVLEKDIIGIDKGVFKGHTNLKEIDLGNITYLEYETFRGCTSLNKVVGKAVKKTGGKVFKDTASLGSVDLPALEGVADCDFENSYLFKISLPNARYIGEKAFSNSKMATVDAPKVESIDRKAFNKCSTMFDFTALNLRELGDEAFMDCYELRNFTAPKIQIISYGAFKNCQQLNKVNIDNVKTIGAEAFSNTGSLESVGRSGSLYLPELIELGTSAFKSSDVVKVYMPSLSILDNWIFDSCKMLEEVNVSNLSEIRDYTFKDCISLKEIDLSKVNRIGKYSFSDCNSLKEVTLKDNVILDNGSFFECRGLETVNGMKLVKSVPDYAFTRCLKLSNIDLSNIVKFGYQSFAYCSSLVEANILNALEFDQEVFRGCSNLKSVNAPKLQSIIYNTFHSCTSLENVNIPNLTYLGYGTFKFTSNLKRITLPSTLNVNDNRGYLIFEGSGLKELVVLSKNYDFNSDAFDGCGSLTVYCFKDTPVDNLSKYPLGSKIYYLDTDVDEKGYYSYAVENGNIYIDIATGCIVDADETITGCNIPKEVMGVNVTEISNGAFNGCNKLNSIIIPDTITNVEDNSFTNSALKTVTILGLNTQISEYFISGSKNDIKIYLYKDSIADRYTYKGISSGKVEKEYINSIKVDGNLGLGYKVEGGFIYISLDGEIIACDLGVTSVIIPSEIFGIQVKGIRDSAFIMHDNLTKVVLPDGLEYVGDNAFSMCYNLSQVTLGNTIKSIGEYAFDTTALESIILPKSLEKVDIGAFNNNAQLKTITIQGKNTVIEKRVFNGCNALKVRLYKDSISSKYTSYPYGSTFEYL